jgi:hypothetical protein
MARWTRAAHRSILDVLETMPRTGAYTAPGQTATDEGEDGDDDAGTLQQPGDALLVRHGRAGEFLDADKLEDRRCRACTDGPRRRRSSMTGTSWAHREWVVVDDVD